MLPSIAALSSVEMIRDGGSLAAVFHGSNGSTYWLFLRIISDHGSDDGQPRGRYERPVVFECVNYWEENRQGWQGINEVELSWPHAAIILHQMKPLLRNDAHARWLTIMLACVEAEGLLPTY